MTDISKNAELQQSCITAVKSRFFAQYWGVNCFQNIMNEKYGYKTYPEPFMDEPNINGQFCKLKSLSNITNEDAEKLQYTLVNVVGLDGLIRQNSIDLVKEVVSNYEQIDCLFMLPSSFADLARELGYAIDWNNYKVSKQIELGWVRLL